MNAPENPSVVEPQATCPDRPLPITGSLTPTADADAPPAVPSHIGRYQVERVLGQGSFGRVYLALDEELRRQVAIKVSHGHRISGQEDAETYLAEARVLASLDHPNIVPIFDVGRTEDGLYFVVSKLIEGSDLARWIRQARPSFAETAGLVAAVAEALHHAHRKGLVHRDVKPGNILIDTVGKPYLADFGLALKEEDFGRGAGLTGTLPYMSPEQARSEGHRVDGRSDIFSLGVVLYELLTGRRPFRGQTVEELLEQITTVEARPPRQIDDAIPRDLEQICLKALAKRVSERYTTARDMADDLEHSLVGQAAAPVPGSAGSAPQDRSLVFVSYSRQNAELVLPLVRLLKASGQQLFVDVYDLEHGADRKAQVAEAVRRSKQFLLFWSKSSLASPLVREEWQLAMASPGCKIVTVVLDRTHMPSELEGIHGTEELAPVCEMLQRRKRTQRLLWLSLFVLAAILAFTMPMLHVRGPMELIGVFLSIFVPWLVILLLPVLIIRVCLGVQTNRVYHKLWLRVQTRLIEGREDGQEAV
jgi:serine/threonine protein kinase